MTETAIHAAELPADLRHSQRPLLVAAGGGGDVLACLMVRVALRRLLGSGFEARLASYAWDRAPVDAVPGPRSPADFDGLRRLGQHNHLVTAYAAARPPAGSLLPRIVATLSEDIVLLDASGGTVGLERQLRECIDLLGTDTLVLVDVGGDIVACGHEPKLRSPLADSLALAATSTMPVPVFVAVSGGALDGELSPDEWRVAQKELGVCGHIELEEMDVGPVLPILDWHPSEASGLITLAVEGEFGFAEIRDRGVVVDVNPQAGTVQLFGHDAVVARNRVAQAFTGAGSIGELEKRLHRMGSPSELAYEREFADATGRRPPSRSWPDHASLLNSVARYARQALVRRIRFVTYRRLTAVLGLGPERLWDVRDILRRAVPTSCRAPALILDRFLLDDGRPGDTDD